jgi:hypothetical protein
LAPDGSIIFNRKSLDFASLLAELDEPDHAGYAEKLAVYT